MSMRACADADVLKFAFSHTALMPHHRTARTLHQTGDSGISRAMRRVALFVLVAGVGFLVWVLLDYANELSIADKLRGVLGIVVFSTAVQISQIRERALLKTQDITPPPRPF